MLRPSVDREGYTSAKSAGPLIARFLVRTSVVRAPSNDNGKPRAAQRLNPTERFSRWFVPRIGERWLNQLVTRLRFPRRSRSPHQPHRSPSHLPAPPPPIHLPPA